MSLLSLTLEFLGRGLTEKPLPRRIQEMHKAYGTAAGESCGGCRHFQRYRQGTHWSKCSLTRQTSGTATDWRAKWPACGRFEASP